MTRKLLFVVGIALLLTAAALIAFDHSAPASVSAQDGGEECDGGPCPEWIVDAWSGSGHADAEAEAFRHWDADDPQEVSPACAKCHSAYGHLDFLGVDGSEAGVVDAPAAVDSVVDCTTCHNPVSVDKMTVVFPSGAEITGTDAGVRCMECHQGRSSKMSVDSALEGLEEDVPNEEIGFINIHYFAAAASLYGSEAQGSYEYEGMAYQTKFEHVPGYDSCIGCHDPHSLELKVDECAMCHTNVASAEDLTAIRMPGTAVDYDGDGSMDESTKDELDGMADVLYIAIQAYAAENGGPIAYESHSYPYFFNDGDGDGMAGEEEANYGNRYTAWTPRLLKAAYNYQAYLKDPGAFAHNAKYHAMVLYDSIASLNEVLPEPIDMSMMHRNPPGHFDGTAEAWRHWDADGEVSGSCTKCHTSEGLPFLLEQGVTISFEPSTSMACSTCHDFAAGGFHATDVVEFPSGAELTFGEGVTSNLCINCHQGRASGPTVDARIGDVGDDEVSEDLGFLNVHYFAAGATLFGSESMGVYQYADKEYAGRFEHVPGAYDTCASCHSPHALTVKVDECATCHGDFGELEALRMMSGDWDGDGADEGVAGELDTLEEALYAAIVAYAADTVGTPVVYESHTYPYFFTDLNGDGEATPDEANYGNQYATWTPRLLKAAYNYQYALKDPGAFAHNAKYVAQALYDSIEDLGGDVSGLTRP